MSYDLATLPNILNAAIAAARASSSNGSVGGCGRVYINLSEVPRANSYVVLVNNETGCREIYAGQNKI